MGIIASTPQIYTDCTLYRLLINKSNRDDGLAEKVTQFIKIASPMLDMINAGPFTDYTLHNKDHAKKVMYLAEYIIDKETLNNLSVLELAILIFMAYLHDLGMCITSTKRSELINSHEIIDIISEWPELSSRFSKAREKLAKTDDSSEKLSIECELYQLQNAALCALLRPKHGTEEIYREVINLVKCEAKRNDLFQLDTSSFEDELIDICISHNLGVDALIQTKGVYISRYPRDLIIGKEKLNTQFCCAILRLADILDFDAERTPHILFESIGIQSKLIPGVDISLKEWNKHMSVHSISINSDEILISATSNHPIIEYSIRQFCSYIEEEIRNTLAVINNNSKSITDYYRISLPKIVRPVIRSVKYVYKEISFKLNQKSILNLLMGENLYSNKYASIRELLQNAIDACGARKSIDSDIDYEPKISCEYLLDSNNYHWLVINDNGIGMDEYVLANYFFNIGSHYYDTVEFGKILAVYGKEKFNPISRFGIGAISVFMIADEIEITTKRFRSPRSDNMQRKISIDGNGGLAYLTESNSGDYGTTIKIRIKDNIEDMDKFWKELRKYLQTIIVRPMFNLSINIPKCKFIFSKRKLYTIEANEIDQLLEQNIRPIIINLSKWSKSISGIIILFLCSDNDTLYIDPSYRIGKQIFPRKFIKNYRGNRITIDGFLFSFDDLNRIYYNGVKIPIILDIIISGNSNISYNISRTSISEDGKKYIKEEIYQAIKQELESQNINLVKKNNQFNGTNHELILKVIELLPDTDIPVNIHKQIAQQLGVSNNKVFKAIMAIKKNNL